MVTLEEGQALLAVVKDGRIVAQTADVALSHARFVEQTLGTLPEGARVVTIGKFQGEIYAQNSRTFHGNQLPAPEHVLDAIKRIFK